MSAEPEELDLGRRQAVRQRILIPPCGGSNPPAPASYYVLDIAYIIVFPGSLFSRVFAGVTGLVSKAICGRDGCTRDFGRDRYENLSGAISWLTFFAGGAADVRRSQSDWRRELADSTICSQRKPRSFRCSAQPAGSRGVRRINVWAVPRSALALDPGVGKRVPQRVNR